MADDLFSAAAQELHTLPALVGPPMSSWHVPQSPSLRVKKAQVEQLLVSQSDTSLKPRERRMLRWLRGSEEES